ncbi:MAG: serine protease [Opitutales bacterium]
MRNLLGSTFFGLAAISYCWGVLASRTWTSSDGKQIQAGLVDAFGAEVLIRRTDGRSFRLPISRLSNADRHYVASALQPTLPKLSPLQAVVLIKGDSDSQGTGFLLQHLGKAYLITNAHVVRGSSRIEVVDVDGRPIRVGDQMEMATDGRDLVRFHVPETAGGLLRTPRLLIGEPCFALGNSGGLNVLTPLPGRMVGAGPKEIEDTCPFIPGNSGGPILSGTGHVLGVATYVARSQSAWWAQGTRFANVRRVAVRLDGVDWHPFSLNEFKKADEILGKVKKDVAGIEHWKDIIRSNPRHPDAKGTATKLMRVAAGLNSGVNGIGAVSRIPFLREDAAQAHKYNKKLQNELRDLLRLVRSQ